MAIVYYNKSMHISFSKGKDTLVRVGSVTDGSGGGHAQNTFLPLAITVMPAIKCQGFSVNETIVHIMG